jgi:hypothetical protein
MSPEHIDRFALGVARFSVAGAIVVACATTQAGMPATTDIAQHFLDQNTCVDQAATREDADACRKDNMVAWCKKFPAAEDCLPLDAGAADGGHE